MSRTEIPEAYKIGWVPFIHSNIFLDSRPLIPRSETEYWVDLAIKEIKASGNPIPRVLDLGAGSGCIGIAVLKEIPEAEVDFVEIDEKHHPTIRKNILINNIDPHRAQIYGGDLFEKISARYDFILSNPPYINPELKGRVGESVLEHEPYQALFGGKGGLEIIKRILNIAPKFLNPGGTIYLEHEPEQTEAMATLPSFLDTRLDQYGVPRFSRFKGS